MDRIAVRPGARQRVAESWRRPGARGHGLVAEVDGPEQLSQHLACVECGLSFAELSPRLFSFNTPHGACPQCTGLGFMPEVDPALVVPDPDLSPAQGALAPWGTPVQAFRYAPRESWFWRRMERVAERLGIDLATPWMAMPEDLRQFLLYGGKEVGGTGPSFDFEGAASLLQRRYAETESDWAREEIEKYMTARACAQCQGARLTRGPAVTVGA